jgi:hypothetical protein
VWVAPHLPYPPNEFFSIETRGVGGQQRTRRLYVHEHERFARACCEPLENPPVLAEGKHHSAFSSAATAGRASSAARLFPQFLRRLPTRDDAAVPQKPADLLQSAVSDNGTKLRPQRNVTRLPVANLAYDLPVKLGGGTQRTLPGRNTIPFRAALQVTGRLVELGVTA